MQVFFLKKFERSGDSKEFKAGWIGREPQLTPTAQITFPAPAYLEMSIGDYDPELAYNLDGTVAFATLHGDAGARLLSHVLGME
jgi:hypothetical protein